MRELRRRRRISFSRILWTPAGTQLNSSFLAAYSISRPQAQWDYFLSRVSCLPCRSNKRTPTTTWHSGTPVFGKSEPRPAVSVTVCDVRFMMISLDPDSRPAEQEQRGHLWTLHSSAPRTIGDKIPPTR